MVIRITYSHTPAGHNGPLTRMECGYGDADAFMRRYAQYAARQVLASHVRPMVDGGGYEVVDSSAGHQGEVLATVVVEQAS